MSSILKALKKLEDESSSPVVDHTWLNGVHEKEAGLDRLKNHCIKHHRIYIAFGLLVLALAAGATLKSKRGLFEKTPEPLISAKPQVGTVSPPDLLKNQSPTPPSIKPTKNIQRQITENRGKETSRLPAARPEKQEETLIPSTRAARSADSAVETSVVETQQPAVRLSTAKISKIQTDFEPDLEMRTYTKDPELQHSRFSETDRFTTAAILDDPDMKLQAISWSENKEKRLAVINDKIVRSGDRIGSYIVLQINPDDVIVRQGEELRKMPFKLR